MPEATIEEEVDAIYELIDDGELDDAGERLQAAIAAFGEDPELRIAKAELALENEDYDSAVATAEASLDEVADDEQTARLRSIEGYAKYYLDDLDGSRHAFNAAVRSDNELVTALIGRAMVHEHLGFLNAAMLDLDRVTDLDDQIGQPFAIRGSIHLRWGNTELAEGDLDHAVRMDPDDEESRLNLARMYALNRRTGEAIELLEPLVENGDDPDFVAPGALLRSQLSLTLGTVDSAQEDADRVIEILPDRPWGYLQSAACEIARGIDGGKAIELLKQAEKRVASERDLPDLYALRASAYEILGKADKALELRQEAEGVARLPAFVYGWLNPARNIPLNPNKPIDIRALLDDLFGEASKAPDGYENVIREIIDKIPELAKEHPNVGQIQIELPEAPGMIGGKRQLVVSLNQQQQQQQRPPQNA